MATPRSDEEGSIDRPPGDGWLRRRWAPWGVLGIGVVAMGPYALLLGAVAPQEGDPGINCGGIGFGETPCGWDSVGVAFALIGVPYLMIVLVVMGLAELGGRRFHWVRVGLAVIAALLPWLAALAVLVKEGP